MQDWISQELSSVDFGDERLDQRMARVLGALSQQPNLSIPSATSCWADTVAAYRFLSNNKVTFETVLESHLEQSRERLGEHPIVILVGDTTELTIKRPNQSLDGIGYPDKQRRGMLLHCLLAFSAEGVPLGLISTQLNNRKKSSSKNSKAKNKPIEEKESYRWVANQLTVKEISEELPNTQFISIYDSEADIFDVLSAFEDKQAQSDYIVRAHSNRVLIGEDLNLHEKILSTQPKFQIQLDIRSKTKKIACNKDKRAQDRKARKADFDVRAISVTIAPPAHLKNERAPQQLNVVSVREVAKPKGEDRIEWILLTTLPINSKAQISIVIQYYCKRWLIEIYFKILKSGCQIENRRFESANTFEPCIAIYLIIAWRNLFITYFSREYPDAPCDMVFTQSEWKALYASQVKKAPPKKAPPLNQMLTLLAQLGGYIPRKNSPPGPKTIWIGMQRLHDITAGWEIANKLL